jgi:hypothetical protein
MTMSPEALAERDVVLHTLDESRADFRTVDGIVDETGIARDIVEEVLSKSPDAVRVSLASGPHGKLLYTRRDKPVTFRERVATLQQMASLV